ncbi:hypothetical protein [Pseudomonas putida]|uniref:hypothetical protein n=1 Tax=Pseudomonas putida TaxID=303 RepID=UPI003D96AFC4
MTSTNHTYGETVVEFYPYDEDEYQALLSKNVGHYNRWSEGLHHKDKAVNVDFVRYMPLELALIELQDLIRQGYSIVKANAESLFFKAILRKPEEIVSAELLSLAETTREEYEQARFELNKTKTAQVLEETIFNKRRATEAEAAAKVAKAAAKQEATEVQTAMADLLAMHAKPTHAATKVAAEHQATEEARAMADL